MERVPVDEESQKWLSDTFDNRYSMATLLISVDVERKDNGETGVKALGGIRIRVKEPIRIQELVDGVFHSLFTILIDQNGLEQTKDRALKFFAQSLVELVHNHKKGDDHENDQ